LIVYTWKKMTLRQRVDPTPTHTQLTRKKKLTPDLTHTTFFNLRGVGGGGSVFKFIFSSGGGGVCFTIWQESFSRLLSWLNKFGRMRHPDRCPKSPPPTQFLFARSRKV
jgi:hypothetical protein